MTSILRQFSPVPEMFVAASMSGAATQASESKTPQRARRQLLTSRQVLFPHGEGHSSAPDVQQMEVDCHSEANYRAPVPSPVKRSLFTKGPIDKDDLNRFLQKSLSKLANTEVLSQRYNFDFAKFEPIAVEGGFTWEKVNAGEIPEALARIGEPRVPAIDSDAGLASLMAPIKQMNLATSCQPTETPAKRPSTSHHIPMTPGSGVKKTPGAASSSRKRRAPQSPASNQSHITDFMPMRKLASTAATRTRASVKRKL